MLPISNDLGRKLFGNSFHIKGQRMNQYIGKNIVNITGTNNVGRTCQSNTYIFKNSFNWEQ